MTKTCVFLIMILAAPFLFGACGTEEARPEPISTGQTVTVEGFCEYTLRAVAVMDAVEDENLSYAAREGMKNLCLMLTVKNLTGEDARVSQFLTVTLSAASGELGGVVYAAAGGAFSSDPVLSPGKETKLYCIAEVAEQTAAEPEQIEILLSLCGQKFRFEGRTDTVYPFITTVEQRADEVFSIYEMLVDLARYKMPFFATPEEAAAELAVFCTRNAPRAGRIREELEGLSPPEYYRQGMESFLASLGQLEAVLTEFSSPENAIAPDAAETVLARLEGEFVQTAGAARQGMPFLMATRYKNIK